MAPPPAAAPSLRKASLEVPSLSLAALEEAHEHVDSVLDEAFGPDGLGIICITGDEAFQGRVREIRGELLPLAPALEKLPEAEREAIREKGTVNVNNYSRGIDGNRSGLYFHPSLDKPGDALPPGVAPEKTFYAENLWPQESLPELRERARQAAPFLVDVGRQLAKAVDRRCSAVMQGYVPGTLPKLVGEPEACNHKCRLICYHEFDSEEQRGKQKGMWAAPHKDTCLLTALVPAIFMEHESNARLPACPDKEVGLYVKDRRGAVAQIAAPAEAGECLFFQVGEALQIVSGGLYHATEHCVRGPPRALAGYVRASLAVFLQPHAHEDLPLPEGVSLREVAGRASDGLFRMFLLYQPEDARGINFLRFCLRDGF